MPVGYKGGPFRVRWLARLREWLAWCCESPACLLGRISAETVVPGVGRSAVETGRGLLLHEISVADETITDLVIVAPTEWNFHPRGVLAEWLQGGAEPSLVDAAIRALDPCVPARILRES
jgi:Ni,Fe-hydrogenase I large subunit